MGMTNEQRARNKERKARIEAAQAETRAVVATGKCPTCSAGLRQNLSITGWWHWEEKKIIEDTQRELIRRTKLPVFGFGKSKKDISFFPSTASDTAYELTEDLKRDWVSRGSPAGRFNVGVQFIYADQSQATHRKVTKKGKKK